MTAISVIELMPSTVESVEGFKEQVKMQLLNGDYDFRKFLYQKKLIEKTFDAIAEDEEVKDFLEKEIEKYGKEGAAFNDITFKIGSRKTWDYSQTGDKELFRLEEQKKELETQIKSRKKILETAKKPQKIVDTETGEVLDVFPANYSEKTFITTAK